MKKISFLFTGILLLLFCSNTFSISGTATSNPSPVTCEDGVCNSLIGETCLNCPQDCGYCDNSANLGLGFVIGVAIGLLIGGGSVYYLFSKKKLKKGQK
jgi:hypothetical protein